MIAASRTTEQHERTKRLRAERRKQGLCVRCGEPSGGLAMCTVHRQAEASRKRVTRAEERAQRDTSNVILPPDRRLCGEQVIGEAREAKSVRPRRPIPDDDANELALSLKPEEWALWHEVREQARDRKIHADNLRAKKYQVPCVDGAGLPIFVMEGDE